MLLSMLLLLYQNVCSCFAAVDALEILIFWFRIFKLLLVSIDSARKAADPIGNFKLSAKNLEYVRKVLQFQEFMRFSRGAHSTPLTKLPRLPLLDDVLKKRGFGIVELEKVYLKGFNTISKKLRRRLPYQHSNTYELKTAF